MSATITWSITQMQVRPTEGQYTDVVITASWVCTGSETSGDVSYAASNNGEATFPMPSGQFTPYDELTQQQVLGWVFTALGEDLVAEIEADVQAQVAALVTPPIITPPLPWAQPTA